MFSSRTRWDLTPNALSALAAEARRSGRALLDLTETNPTRAGLPAPRDLLALLSREASLAYAPDPRGLPSARAAVAHDFAGGGTRSTPTGSC